LQVPKPTSAGLILSYRCMAECAHCMYACTPRWNSPWISEADLRAILGQLAPHITPAPWGPDSLGLSDGLHFTGGEPFLDFELLCTAFEMAKELNIPSVFAETNGFWCVNDGETRDRMALLRSKGMRGLMVSVNPFFLPYVPFERTERAIRIGLELFGRNLMVYQLDYFRRFRAWGLKGKIPLEEYLRLESRGNLLRNVEFFVMGRAPFRLRSVLRELLPLRPAQFFFRQSCNPPFLRSWPNHFDNFGNYVPGFCGGLSLGDCRDLESLLRRGVDLSERPVLGFIANDDFAGLFRFAQERDFQPQADGYFSKCHLCMDLRRHLAAHGDFVELSPREFYLHLDEASWES
jgi:hypothetical protein